MGMMVSQITSLTIVYSTVYSGADERKYQSSASLLLRGIHQSPVNSPHKRPVAQKMFPFDDVIMILKLQAQVDKWLDGSNINRRVKICIMIYRKWTDITHLL